MNAPDRLHIDPDHIPDHSHHFGVHVEYIRADIAADEIERLREAMVRIQDLTQHNMGMSASDERCVHREATGALLQKEPK